MSLPAFAARRLLARGSTLLGGSSVALLASFLQTVLVARSLGPTSFGIWAGIQAFCTVVATLLTFRTSEPVTRYLAEYQQRREAALATNPSGEDAYLVELLLGTAIATDALTQIFAILVIGLSAPWAAPLLPGGEEVLALYPIMAIGLLRNLFDGTWFSVARNLSRYRTIATLNALFPTLRLSATTICWSLNVITLQRFVTLMTLLGIVQMAITGWYLWRAIHTDLCIKPTRLFSFNLLKRQRQLGSFWSFMKATFLWSLFSALVKEGDILILGGLRPAEEVGWYRLAKNLTSIVQQVGEMLAQVIYQDFSEQVVVRNGAALRDTIRFLAKTWLPAVVAVSLISITLAYFAIPLIFGGSYQATFGVFSILMIGTGCVTALFWVRPLTLAFELYWYNFQVVAWGSGLFLGADWIFIHIWGVHGAALAFATLTTAGPLVMLPPVWGRLQQMSAPSS